MKNRISDLSVKLSEFSKKKPHLLVFFTVAALLLTLILASVILRTQKETPPMTSGTPSPTPVPPTAVLYSDQEVVKDGKEITIMLDAKRNLITALQMEIKYDPEVLSSVKITPVYSFSQKAFFGEQKDQVLLRNKQDAKIGRVSYAVGIAPTSLSKAGIGKIATLSYVKKPNTPATTITFLMPKTRATQARNNGSVLAKARNITIE